MNSDAETAVLQALVARAVDGVASASVRELARATGISRQRATRVTEQLISTGQISVYQKAQPGQPTMWKIPQRAKSPGQERGPGVARFNETDVENGVPTMPFQLLAPTGLASSWFEQIYRQLTRNYADAASGRISVNCRKCADTGYYLEQVSEQYSRKWLHTCSCESGQWKVIPEDLEYMPPAEQDLCLMCENTGWVIIAGEAQRCYSCRKTLA